MKPQPMSDEELSNLVRDAHIKFCLMAGGSFERVFADAIEARVNAQWAAMIGEPVAYRVEVDGLWFHARDRGGLITALGVKLGISRGDLQPSPLYAIKETPSRRRHERLPTTRL